MRSVLLLLFGLLASLSGFAGEAMSAREIVEQAQRAAGGALWLRPKTLYLRGSATLYADGAHAAATHADQYEMWREFPRSNASAHEANGKVRIDAKRGAQVIFQTAFDGQSTYNQQGLVPGAVAAKEWSEAFGFGIIRFALSPEFALLRLANDVVDAKPCFVVRVRDASATDTTFWIDQASWQIRKVGFDTPKGWHERVYSDFFTLPNGWVQPGRVRLTYRGALSNDIRWTHAEVNKPIAASRFVITAPKLASNAASDSADDTK